MDHSSKKYNWYKIAGSINEINWQENNMSLAEVNGKTITLIRSATQIFACAHKCPHAAGILADGFIDATGNIVCPLHRYKFDLKNGRNTSGEGYYLKTYLTEHREDGLFIGFEEKNWLNWS
jgi:3-phenylpropionate/trans-cinnamate dioxygenase ferredoxin subunit